SGATSAQSSAIAAQTTPNRSSGGWRRTAARPHRTALPVSHGSPGSPRHWANARRTSGSSFGPKDSQTRRDRTFPRQAPASASDAQSGAGGGSAGRPLRGASGGMTGGAAGSAACEAAQPSDRELATRVERSQGAAIIPGGSSGTSD